MRANIEKEIELYMILNIIVINTIKAHKIAGRKFNTMNLIQELSKEYSVSAEYLSDVNCGIIDWDELRNRIKVDFENR